MKLYWQGELAEKPRLPGYRGKGGLAAITYPRQALKLKDGLIRLPLGAKVKACFGVDSFTLAMPTNLKFEDIRELRILPRNRCFYVEFVYKMQAESVDVEPSRALGIDPGLSNWLTYISKCWDWFHC